MYVNVFRFCRYNFFIDDGCEHAKNGKIKFCMGIFTTALSYINTLKFSIKIPHLTSTVHRLLSDHLLCWKEPILSSYSFLGVLRKEKPFSLIFLRAVVNISIQTLIISPWLLFRKMIDDHLTAGAWAACDQTRNASCLQWRILSGFPLNQE